MRRHYVYYRVAEAELGALAVEILAWQRSLCQRHPGLQAELLRRAETHDGQATLMEVYGPLEAPLAELIEAEARALRIDLQRHVETFETVALP